jgi:hypothetical protein
MTLSWNHLDLASLAESSDLECKAAQGRDGRGELPEDFWKSYSAMANTDGGVILLGIQEKPRGEFRALGLADVEKLRKALWDNLHNRKQVSCNLLTEQSIAPIEIDGKTVLRIQVPRAARQQKPVHVGSNPFGGTYLRRYEGDYAADDETVRRLMAERVEDSRDERVLKGFDFSDLDMDTVAAYRNRFAAVRSPATSGPTCRSRISWSGWAPSARAARRALSGLRLAGLLMFGRAEVIRDALPHYMVDYQERPEPRADKRWIDRLVPDGSWSGNVYDFFRKVYQKLTADLKVPFQLQEGQRVDDTPVHEALREALANTLIHADFTGSGLGARGQAARHVRLSQPGPDAGTARAGRALVATAIVAIGVCRPCSSWSAMATMRGRGCPRSIPQLGRSALAQAGAVRASCARANPDGAAHQQPGARGCGGRFAGALGSAIHRPPRVGAPCLDCRQRRRIGSSCALA